MTYIDSFVAPVPTANRQQYIRHAKTIAPLFREYGALSYTECWGDDIPDGEITSFPRAVACEPGETVCFGWVVWPSREARERGMQQMRGDERMSPQNCPLPFDGRRLIFGGFEVIVEA